jgi:methyl-accepting chemotaxis protein
MTSAPWSLATVINKTETYAPIKALRNFMVICGVIVLLVLMIMIFVNIENMIKPVIQIKDQLHEIADGDGDLTKTLHIRSKDEVGELAQSFNKLLSSLRVLLKKVSDSAETVAASSEELSSASEQASQITQQVAVTVSQIATGTQQESASVSDTVEAVQPAKKQGTA